MPFQRGRQKTGGRKPGVTNRFTGTFREAVQIAYDGIGGHHAFTEWARQNPTEYYRIAARLIPLEIKQADEKTINVIINRAGSLPTPPIDVLDVAHRETPAGPFLHNREATEHDHEI